MEGAIVREQAITLDKQGTTSTRAMQGPPALILTALATGNIRGQPSASVGTSRFRRRPAASHWLTVSGLCLA